MRSESYEGALARYARIRRIAYDLVTDEAIRQGTAGSTLRLTDIGTEARAAWRKTWTHRHPSGHGGWDWERLALRFRRRPSAFQLALWSGDRLCGLAVGRASARRVDGRRHTLSIHYMESTPEPDHPLKRNVALLITSAADVYGSALGASRLLLVYPLPGVLSHYARLGFTVAWWRDRPVYCEREILP
jgi:hypothetical protein